MRRVGLADVDVSGGFEVGARVGRNRSSISASYVTGEVSGTTNVGGLVGLDTVGAIVSSYSRATVSGTNNVGGLVGRNVGRLTATSAVA